MSTAITVIVSILIFGVLIMVHELGHFLAARASGVVVNEFSIGMGPLIWKKTRGNTQYSVRALPLGGYCRMKGEEGEEEETQEDADGESAPKQPVHEAGSIFAASPLKRIFIFASGALMNFLIAVLIFFVLMLFTGTDASTTIASMTDASPARAAGIEVGDTILSIDGTAIREWDDITGVIKYGTGSPLSITVEKQDGGEETYVVTPYYDEASDTFLIGITPKAKTNVFHAFTRSFVMLGTYVVLILQVFVGIFTGKYGLDTLSGPIGAAALIGEYIPQGLIYVMSIAASISISLGVLNLLPIPALDGSRIIFSFIELIKGSPVNRRAEGMVHLLGFAALIALGLFIAYKDILTFL